MTPGRAYLVLFALNLVAIGALWWNGLDPGELATPHGVLNAAGRITGLFGAYLLLIQLILRTHVGWLVPAFGKDSLKKWHTRNGYGALALIVGHVLLQFAGYAIADRVDPLAELGLLLTKYEGMALAFAGFALLSVLTALAYGRVMHRIAWPTWRALHLFTYVAIALAAPHVIATGSDFIDAPLGVAYWVALEATALVILLVARIPAMWAATAVGLRRPQPVVAAVAAAVLAVYLFGTVRLAPAEGAGPSPTARIPPTPATGGASPRPSASPPALSLVVLGDEIETPYGTAQVRLVLTDGRIADVEPVQLPSATKRSRTISQSVEPWLRKRAIAAQSADFDVLSGATYTSHAYQASLTSALRAAGAPP